MRRIKMLVGFLGMLLVLTRDNTNVAKASETTYYRYDEVVTGTAESGQTFDKINATQYDTPLTASFFKNGVQQTQVLTYSIGTYINKILASAQSDTLRNVLTEMYEFGQAAKNYVRAQ